MSASLDSTQDNLKQQRVVLLLDYYGPAFSGSQVQPRSYTVQAALADALAKLNVAHGPLVFSGRTDAGVHAKGQVVHFDTALDALGQIPDVLAGLNAVLPHEISVKDYHITGDFDFHAMLSPEWRWYQYRIFNQRHRSVWKRPDAAWVPRPLDVDRMQRAARYFLGEQLFTSFKCPRTEISNDLCHVIQSHVYQDGADIVYDVVANRFIYKMVRNIVGTLIEVGTGSSLSPEDIPEILGRADRQYAGPTAKPEGLCLMAVNYPKPWDFFKNDVYVTTLKQRVQESSSHENILCKAS